MLEKIEQDFKQALKNKDEITVSALRNLKAEIKNVEIAAQIGRASPDGREKQKALTAEQVLTVIRKKVKQHKDSIESFAAGNRNDLVDHEKAQMAVLEKYLPAAASEDEVRRAVKSAIANLNAQASDFGKVMKQVVGELKGAADGSVISKIVKEELK